jgi:hypothetical protein
MLAYASRSLDAGECRRWGPFMARAGAFEWQGHEGHGVYFLFMATTLPFACVYNRSPAVVEGRQR